MKSLSLTRRALLKAGSASLALLPFLPTGALSQTAQFPKRLVVFWTPNGLLDPEYTPDGGETDFTLRAILEPLQPFRDRLTILKELDFLSYFNDPVPNDHGPPLSHNLCATTTIKEAGDVYLGGGPSIDQFIAQRMNRPGSYDGLVLGLDVYQPHAQLSYRAARDAVPQQDDPREVFETMFASGGDGPELERIKRRRGSVLDIVSGELKSLEQRLPASERIKLQRHLAAIEAQQQRLNQSPACATVSFPEHLELAGFEQLLAQQTSNLALALSCDLARVASLHVTMPGSNHVYDALGVSARHHDLSHAFKPQPGSSDYADLTKIGRFFAQSLAQLLAELDAIPEGDGSVLDNTVVMWTSEHKSQDGAHDRRDVPFLLAGSAGGRLSTGRLLRFGGRAHNDLFVTLCQALGFEDVTTFGDASVCAGPLPGLLA